jgi:hypothetical protein
LSSPGRRNFTVRRYAARSSRRASIQATTEPAAGANLRAMPVEQVDLSLITKQLHWTGGGSVHGLRLQPLELYKEER